MRRLKPQFLLSDHAPSIPASAARFHVWTLPNGQAWTEFYRTSGGYLLRFPALADFDVGTDGAHVVVRRHPGISEETLAVLFNNQVLPLALSLQGEFVLHASSVALGGFAVGFVAESGRGKSTLAASFAREGHAFLGDDGLRMRFDEEDVWIQPSPDSVRLWADSADALLAASAPKAPRADHTSKARILSHGELPHCTQEQRLAALYFLGDGSAVAPCIEPMPAQDAVAELVRYSFLMDIKAAALLDRHLRDLARVVRAGLCFHLDYPRRYDLLPQLREAVIRHAGLCAAAQPAA